MDIESTAGAGASPLATLAALSTMTFDTLESAVEAYLALAMRVAGTRGAFLANFDAGYLRILAARDEGGCQLAVGSASPYPEHFCQYVRAGAVPVIVTDAANDPRVGAIPARARVGIGSYLGVPVIAADGGLYGTMCALDPMPRRFNADQISLMQIIAQNLAGLLNRDSIAGTLPGAAPAIERADSAAPAERASSATPEDMSAILRIVAHDIRNPLNAIQSAIDLLLSEFYGTLAPEQGSMLAMARESAQFINRLTLDLMDTAAAEVGLLSVQRHQFNPAELLATVVDAARPLASRQRLQLHLAVEPDLPPMVADADRVRQIVQNLLSNALRYTKTGHVTVGAAEAGGRMIFSVEDTGPGIPEAVQETIWDQHVRASGEGAGVGLGLYIVRRLVQAMGGAVGLTSAVGQGSRFWVSLPLVGPAPHQDG